MRALQTLALAGVLAAPAAYADSSQHEQIRVDAGLTGAWVGVSDRNGSGLVVEIKSMLNDQLALGGRVEMAVMFGGRVGDADTRLDIAMAACGLVKAEYFIGDAAVRPFVGLGVGGYTIGAQSIDDSASGTRIQQQTGRYVGVAPQVGLDIGRLRLAATYNAILGATLEVQQQTGTGYERIDEVSQNYLSLELSFRFAGPRTRSRAPACDPRATVGACGRVSSR